MSDTYRLQFVKSVSQAVVAAVCVGRQYVVLIQPTCGPLSPSQYDMPRVHVNAQQGI